MRILVQEVSNWGLWGNDDELGAANLITPAKRKQALALAKEALPNVLKDGVVTRPSCSMRRACRERLKKK